jgi:hypothetical protein
LKINDCGTCLDCREKNLTNLKSDNDLDTIIEIHAFEPIESNYEALLQVRTHFNISTLYIYQLAISNTNGTAEVLRCRAGQERCGLGMRGVGVNTERTPIFTDILDTSVPVNVGVPVSSVLQ